MLHVDMDWLQPWTVTYILTDMDRPDQVQRKTLVTHESNYPLRLEGAGKYVLVEVSAEALLVRES